MCYSQNSKLSSTQSWNDSSFTVHGRLQFYNGNPGCRIWIIGTNHLLGINEELSDKGENPDMPDSLKHLLEWGTLIYGDFKVHPISKYRSGEMQYVRVLSFSNLVIKKH
jgi:hypothetical protein